MRLCHVLLPFTFSVLTMPLSWAQDTDVPRFDVPTTTLNLPLITGYDPLGRLGAELRLLPDTSQGLIFEVQTVLPPADSEYPAFFDINTRQLTIPNFLLDDLWYAAELNWLPTRNDVAYYELLWFAPLPAALYETEPTAADDAAAAAIWVHPDNPAESVIIGTDNSGGLEVYDLSGQRLQIVGAEEPKYVDVRYNFPLGDTSIDLIVTSNESDGSLGIYTIDSITRVVSTIAADTIQPDFSAGVDGLCLYHSAVTNLFYVYVMDGEGAMQQWELVATDTNQVSANLIRQFNTGGETSTCIADDEYGYLFVSEEESGIWRYGAEPEAGLGRVLIDSVPPLGELVELEGLDLYYAGGGQGYLIASNQDQSNFFVYDRAGEHAHLGRFSIQAAAVDGVEETDDFAVTSFALNNDFPFGLFVTQDDSNPDANKNFKLVPWEQIAELLGLTVDSSVNPRQIGISSDIAAIEPTVETAPVQGSGDAADDPAIWIHPTDASLSTIIGTQKDSGLAVYDLSGAELQFVPDGEINNVDLRYNFPLGGVLVTLVAATNRTDDSLSVYTVNPETRQLENVAARSILVGLQNEAYGFCMYHSPMSGKFYGFANDQSGVVEQWEFFDDGSGQVDATLVRTFNVNSQTEGCVADDETGDFYLGEENVGIWKFSAEPDAASEGRLLDVTQAADGNIVADVEGLSLYYGSAGGGYLLASSQGDNSFLVYERGGDNTFIGRFQVVANEALNIDGVSETDGLDVTNVALGAAFPQGVFVAQDGRNIVPAENQNFKLVPWEHIAEALGLVVDTGYQPRQ